MKRLVQKLRNGALEVVTLPSPSLEDGAVLIDVKHSLISSGTELSTVAAARASLVGKARSRPAEVTKVIQSISTQGIHATLLNVEKKLNSFSPLGYSVSGVVVAVGSAVNGIKKGDLVAAAGISHAVHSEQVLVPSNLVVSCKNLETLHHASFVALGSIAMQAVRVAQPQVCETAAVVGVGLIGQLLISILKANGVEATAFDMSEFAKETARARGFPAFDTDSDSLDSAVLERTKNHGFDHVFICAATTSNQPINSAGRIARKKGQIIIVGDVSADFDREPYFYKKELVLKMSCSYGPGRYDANYEEKGRDYPYAYVRWTEKRNMEAFVRLIESEAIDIRDLVSHRFEFENALAAYELLFNKPEPYLGIMLDYKTTPDILPSISSRMPKQRESAHILDTMIVGAGSYCQGQIIPRLSEINDINFECLVNRQPQSGLAVQRKYNFSSLYTDIDLALPESNANTIFITTQHNTHADMVIKAVNAGLRNIYVEKPLCIKKSELMRLREVLTDDINLVVGFNRTFSPHFYFAKDRISSPTSIIYKVNAGLVDETSWVADEDKSGGRLVGEVCHFIDFILKLTDSAVTEFSISKNDHGNQNIDYHITILLESGCVATVIYNCSGTSSLPKEYVEVHGNGQRSIVIEDFKKSLFYDGGVKKVFKTPRQDKGQASMIKQVTESFRAGEAVQTPDYLLSLTQLCLILRDE